MWTLLVRHSMRHGDCCLSCLQNKAASRLVKHVCCHGPTHAGLGKDARRLLFLDSCQEQAKRTLRIPRAALAHEPNLTVCTHLVDAHLYVLQRDALLLALAKKPGAASLKHVRSALADQGKVPCASSCARPASSACTRAVTWHPRATAWRPLRTKASFKSAHSRGDCCLPLQALLPFMVRHQHHPPPAGSSRPGDSGSLGVPAPQASPPPPAEQQPASSSSYHSQDQEATPELGNGTIPELRDQWRCQVTCLMSLRLLRRLQQA